VELISRIMDGSIPYDPAGRLEPVSAGLGAKQDDKIERLRKSRSLKVAASDSSGVSPRSPGSSTSRLTPF